MSGDALVARDYELAQGESVVDRVAAGHGRVVLIEGAAGLGKSALLTEIALRAGSRRFTVASARGRGKAGGPPGATINAALSGIGDGPFDAAAEPELVSRLASAEPLALMIDDAHLADELSLRLLTDLAQRLRPRSILLAIAMRPLHNHATRITELAAIEHTLHITLRALDGKASDELIRAVLGDTSAAFCAECATLTGGNPFLLKELITWVSANRFAPVAGAPAKALEPVPHRAMREFVRSQLDELGPEAIAMASAVALSDRGLSFTEAVRIAGLDSRQGLRAMDAMLESGLMAAGEPLAFAIPLTTHCLRAERHATMTDDPGRGVAELAGRSELEALSAHHRPLTPHLHAGRSGSTTSLAAGVGRLEHTQERAHAPIGDPLRAQAETRTALAALLVPDSHGAALARIDQLNSSPDASGQLSSAEVLLATAWQRLCRGDPSEQIVDIVRNALASHDGGRVSLGGYFDTTAAGVFALVDDFKAAEHVCDEAQAAARLTGSGLAERNVEVARALALLHRGRIGESAERCTALLSAQDGSSLNRSVTAAILATAEYERDAADEAQTIVREALRWSPTHELPQLLLLETESRLCLRRGEVAKALAIAQEAEFLAESLGIVNPAVVAWQPVAAVCYAFSGQRDRAVELVDEAGEIAERFGSPRARAVTLRAKAMIVGQQDELGHLELAHAALEYSDAELERAKVLVEFGAALHRAGRDCAARTCLRQGIDLADRLGAIGVSRRGLSSLLVAGGRPRRARMTGPESLTPGERRVVDLASSGASNREIAEALFVTRKTVEWHLGRAFAKLNVSSREELAGIMGAEPVERRS